MTSEELLDVMEEARAWLENLFTGKSGRRTPQKGSHRQGAQLLFDAESAK